MQEEKKSRKGKQRNKCRENIIGFKRLKTEIKKEKRKKRKKKEKERKKKKKEKRNLHRTAKAQCRGRGL